MTKSAPDTREAPSADIVLDDLDNAILSALFKDGRTPLADLRVAIGQSESAIRRRIIRLRALGVLYFDIQVDPDVLGRHVQAVFWIVVSPAALDSIGRALAGHPEVAFAAAVTGPANLMAFALFRTARDLYMYITHSLGMLGGIQSVETSLIVRQVKQYT